LGIPGDNSYANFAEANRAFWRQTIVPLVRRTAETIGRWLDPAVDGELVIAPDLDRIEALAEDRAALWQRVASADFLTDDEKRRLVGLEASE
ncbi:MAG: phage portal protein, partial [Hyphomicrobiaceae bacterium]|nr:phage portal protein [Hyphomicrobiaceae bacterium]